MFVGAVLAAAGLGVRRRTTRVSGALDRQLALGDVPPATLRDAVRGTQGTQATYLVLTGLTSALPFTAVGLGEDGPTALLLYAGVAVVVVWMGVMEPSLGRAYRAAVTVIQGASPAPR